MKKSFLFLMSSIVFLCSCETNFNYEGIFKLKLKRMIYPMGASCVIDPYEGRTFLEIEKEYINDNGGELCKYNFFINNILFKDVKINNMSNSGKISFLGKHEEKENISFLIFGSIDIEIGKIIGQFSTEYIELDENKEIKSNCFDDYYFEGFKI